MSFFGLGKSHKPMPDTEKLVTLYDFGLRSVIESLLRDAEIPYIIKDCGGSWSVITGTPMLGADVYVKTEDLERASELIAPCFDENDAIEPEFVEEEEEES